MSDNTPIIKIQPPNGEAGASLNVEVLDADGIRTQLTLRAESASDWLALLRERKAFIEAARKNGWQITRQAAPTSAPAPSTPAAIEAALGAPSAPKAAPQGSGETFSSIEDFQASEISVSADDKGKMQYKVKGGRYSKFGVRVWPETLAALGLDATKLQLGTYQFSAMVRAVLDENGKATKIIGLTHT